MTWWVWIVAGLGIAAAELFVPGYMFVGFGLGALVTGGLVWAGIVDGDLPWQFMVFAGTSLACWIGLRRVLGLRSGQVKRIDRDINEN